MSKELGLNDASKYVKFNEFEITYEKLSKVQLVLRSLGKKIKKG